MVADGAGAAPGVAGRGGRVGEAAAAPRAGPAATLSLRPTLVLPPRSSFESLFRGVAAEVSPGPLTLVSSFFAEDADSECRSFTQLLVGAMNSPVAAARRVVGPDVEQKQSRGDGRVDRSSGIGGAVVTGHGGGPVRLEQYRPSSLAITPPQLFAVSPGLSHGALLDSPAFFSSPLSDFRISHQEALAQVTAHAAQSQFRMLGQAESPSSLFTEAATTLVHQSVPDMPTLQSNNSTLESTEDSQSDQISQPEATIVSKPAEDGYNWRKYGQKVVKGSEYPRSYYKCTHPNCQVKKKVERSVDGEITEIIYKSQHCHQKPPPNKRAREGGNLPSGSNETKGKIDQSTTFGQGFQHDHGMSNKTNTRSSCATISQRGQDPGTSDGSSENEEMAETKVESEPDHKRRNISTSSQKTTTEPRIIVQTTSEVDLLDDGFRWRKYGQKVVKGNPNPRSYYKCTFGGCNVRKHIERSSTDSKAVITTYEGKHNHDPPAARSSSHNMVNVVPSSAGEQSNQASIRSTKFGKSSEHPVAILQLKGEHEIT